ncbi:ABC transporter ATP-binding protein [Ornatilinea apprima]|uniref:ABC transporter ATP-binding protein n=1 Tax=Ornatilinea apprima TaxID=1134406 RepID=UPI00094682F4|nr:ATP-binding cassette domain-containing protein [Ornatilinea apprima]
MLTSLFRKKLEVPVVQTTGESQPIVRIRDLVKTYSSTAGDFTVLKNIHVDFYPGEFVGVIGKSGSGKSTLINMITGIDRPTQGEVYVGNVAVHSMSENEMAIWRGRNMGIVFQFFQLLPMLSLLENVMLPMDFCNMYSVPERYERAMYLLRMVEMQDHANKLPSAISGGQQQRVAIARALANDPPVIVADEPTGNLDSKTAEAVFAMFEQLIDRGKTIVMVTHDSSLAKRVTRTVLIADGEVVNEYVFRAMPTLTHQQMLHVTKELVPMTFEPGQVIMRESDPGDHFYIVTEGEVEIALKRPDGVDVVVTRLGPGKYFGEIELMQDRSAVATVRAAASGVKVAALDHADFDALLAESEQTRNAMEYNASKHLNENVSARDGEKL